jgi:hypothetical protein
MDLDIDEFTIEVDNVLWQVQAWVSWVRQVPAVIRPDPIVSLIPTRILWYGGSSRESPVRSFVNTVAIATEGKDPQGGRDGYDHTVLG